MEVDDNILLNVDVPQGLLDQQLRLHPIYSLNINIILNYILLNCLIFFLTEDRSEGAPSVRGHGWQKMTYVGSAGPAI